MGEYGQNRRRGKLLPILLSALLVATLPTLLLAAATPGPQFQVNTFTVGTQRDSAVGMNAAGKFVIAWISQGQDGDGYGIFAQRFNANGTPQGTEFQVNTTTAGDQVGPSAAMDNNGNFVIAWYGNGIGDNDGVFARRFDSNGNPQGREFLVNTTTAGSQRHPAVRMDATGNFVVAWETGTPGAFGFLNSGGIFAQRFDANGVAQGVEFQINTSPSASRFDSLFDPPGQAMGMDSAGNFVVVWAVQPPFGNPTQLVGQLFGANGTKVGTEFSVNTSSSNVSRPAVEMNGSGNFVVAWEPGSGRLFHADGTPVSPEFNLSAGFAGRPSAGMDVTGNIVVGWEGRDAASDNKAIFLRQFDANGQPQGAEQVASDTRFASIEPAAKMDAAGNFVVAFTNFGQDGDREGVFARQYTVPSVPPSISINDVRVFNSGTTNAIFTVSLSKASDQTVTVDFATADGTATSGKDYQPNSGTLTFAPGETSQQVTVLILSNTMPEPDKTFFVNLGNATNANIFRSKGVGTILNDNNTLSINDVAVINGNTGTKLATFTVKLSPSSSFAVTVDFSTSDGSAIANRDYLLQAGRLTFQPGETSKQINITVNGDLIVEPDKTFFVVLSNSTNATITKPQGLGTIINDNFPTGSAGGQFLVNTTVAGYQFSSAVAMNAAGASVVAWTSDLPGGGEGIFGQRFNADGTRAGAEFRVDDAACPFFPRKREAAVAMDAGGDFVIVWTVGGGLGDLLNYNFDLSDVCAQRYRYDGTPQGTNFQVDTNSNDSLHAQQPAIGMYGSGEFVIAWTGFGRIFAKRFDSNGATLGSTVGTVPCTNIFTGLDQVCDIVVNSSTARGSNPTVAVNPGVPSCTGPCGTTLADFYIAWDGSVPDQFGTGISARGFSGSNGLPLGNEFRVDTNTENAQYRPLARMDEDGNLVVVWEGEDRAGVRGIFGQLFGPPSGPCPPGAICGGSFGPHGSQFQVAAARDQLFNVLRTGLAMSAHGSFVVTWNDYENDTTAEPSILARYFAADGTPQSDLFQVDEFGSNYYRPAVGMNAAGNFLTAWEGGNDGSFFGIYARRFTVSPLPSLSIDSVTIAKPASGTVDAVFTVTLSAASAHTVSVDFATADDSAHSGTDFNADSGTLTFLPGDTSKQIIVHVIGGPPDASSKTFFVNLTHPSNATIARSQGVGTIQPPRTPPPQPVQITINETILVSDTPSVLPAAMIGVTENVVVTDAPNVLPSAMIGVAENITVADGPMVQPSAMIAVIENVAVTDAPQVGNTPVGSNVVVMPVDSGTGGSPVTITFSNVTQTGETTLTISGSGPAPPNGFTVGNPPVYFDLSTTALYTGDITVCFNYSGIAFRRNAPHLFHYENGAWVDRTILPIDTVNHIVCARVTSFSFFGAFEPDTTPPQIQCAAPDGQWHGADVILACTANDPETGLRDPADASFSLSTHVAAGMETSNASTDTRQVCDNAGNCATAGPIAGNKVDKKPPSISCAPSDGQWHANDVSVACTAADSGSGLVNAPDASFWLATHVPAGTEISNASTDSRQVCDQVGNCATAGSIGGNKVDKKPPSITITVPSGTYLLGQMVAASYSCMDGGSGVASCNGPVATGANIDTASVGGKDFSVNATDNVGNSTSSSVQYTVSYSVQLLYDSLVKKTAGSTYPIKLQLRDAAGRNVSSPSIVLHAVSVNQASNNAPGPLDDSGNANPDLDFRYDASLQGYIFNLSLKCQGTQCFTTGTYNLNFTAGADPAPHSAPFAVK